MLDNGQICGKIQNIKGNDEKNLPQDALQARRGLVGARRVHGQRAVSEPAAMSRTPHPRYRMTEMTAAAVN